MRTKLLALYFALLMIVGMFACEKSQAQTSNPSTSAYLISANNCNVPAAYCTGYTNGSTGRIVLPQQYMIGSGTNNFQFCGNGTGSALEVIAEGSFDGNSAHWTPLTNVYSTPSSGINGNPCTTISFGGFYPYLAFNVLARTTNVGTLDVWYYGIPGASAFLPSFANSAGATSGTSCDQQFTTTGVAASGLTLLIARANVSAGRTLKICHFDISFAGAISSASLVLEYCTYNTGICTNPHGLWNLLTDSSTSQFLSVNDPITSPTNQDLVLNTGAIGTTLDFNISYAIN